MSGCHRSASPPRSEESITRQGYTYFYTFAAAPACCRPTASLLLLTGIFTAPVRMLLRCLDDGIRTRRSGGGSMSCERCGGLMILEHGFSVMGLVENPEVDARRCLNCGNMIDATILANRASACKQNSGEHHAMPVRHPRTHQLVRLNRLPQDRTLQTEGVIAECPRGHAPHPPVGAPSVQTPQFESAHLAPHSPRAAHQRRCI